MPSVEIRIIDITRIPDFPMMTKNHVVQTQVSLSILLDLVQHGGHHFALVLKTLKET